MHGRISTQTSIHIHGERAAGDAAAGPHACSDCDYVVTVYRALPTCPMCGGDSWSATPGKLLRLRRAPAMPADQDDELMAA
jgi:Zn finger protein HypA/HybF involved in hydrogenase expression